MKSLHCICPHVFVLFFASLLALVLTRQILTLLRKGFFPSLLSSSILHKWYHVPVMVGNMKEDLEDQHVLMGCLSILIHIALTDMDTAPSGYLMLCRVMCTQKNCKVLILKMGQREANREARFLSRRKRKLNVVFKNLVLKRQKTWNYFWRILSLLRSCSDTGVMSDMFENPCLLSPHSSQAYCWWKAVKFGLCNCTAFLKAGQKSQIKNHLITD